MTLQCGIRACKHNKDNGDERVCGKYPSIEALKEDFQKGGGCAFTWFFSGQLPKTVTNP
jgi:hypothetical protein